MRIYVGMPVLVMALICVLGCQNKKQSGDFNNSIAATVYGKNLHYSDIDIDLPDGLSDDDKSKLVSSYIEHWARKEMLAHDAVRDIEDFGKIDRLVDDYKNSLIIARFKNKYIRENLDSTITKQQLDKFYNTNKNQFKLDHDVINLIFAKFKDDKYNLDKFYENWKKKKYRYISDYCERNSDDYPYKKDVWYDLEEVKKNLPSYLKKNKDSYEIQINKKGYEYFLKIFDTKHKNENIPLDMVKEKVEKLILQKRKSDIIDKYIEKLYKNEIADGKIKIYR